MQAAYQLDQRRGNTLTDAQTLGLALPCDQSSACEENHVAATGEGSIQLATDIVQVRLSSGGHQQAGHVHLEGTPVLKGQ